jgi:hypothetical protein
MGVYCTTGTHEGMRWISSSRGPRAGTLYVMGGPFAFTIHDSLSVGAYCFSAALNKFVLPYLLVSSNQGRSGSYYSHPITTVT